MKTRIFGKWGIIEVRTSSFDTVEFVFPTHTLVDWYPLDINYEYRYNPENNRMYLIPLEKKEASWEYGITTTKNRVCSEVASFEVETWFNKEVSEKNHRDVAKGKNLGIVGHDEDYDSGDVNENTRILVEEVEKAVINRIEDKMLRETSRGEFDTYRRMEFEQKDKVLYQYAEEEDLELLQFYGRMRIMTNLMRQGAGM